MNSAVDRAIAIVGVGAVLPDAPDVPTFWANILNGRYSIGDTPPERWSIADYYDPDPFAPDKTYSKIGGWVRDYVFDWKHFRIPPKVAAAMDAGQQWALMVAEQTLQDYGYPARPLDTDRTAVVLGTAMGGERVYDTYRRIVIPIYQHALERVAAFQQIPDAECQAILAGWRDELLRALPEVTEDSMPGELPNIVSGRVANVLNLRGPNFITDAACASSLAAVSSAVELLVSGQVDAVVTGGVDHNMDVSSFVKFCKIGALSATGSRPFGAGADGFVMGEGAAAFLLKRLADAERDGDRIYAVIRGVGGASDGKGKGIYAPNPLGQELAIRRAWQNAGLDPTSASLIEAHGTSTRVGDVVEFESLQTVFCGAPAGSIALGSVKSNIGHLKAAAGAAGLLKACLAVYHQVMPATLNASMPNPNIDFKATPFYLNLETRPWPANGVPRRCGVGSNGFGGTNFHLVLEEYRPGLAKAEARSFAGARVEGGKDSLKPLRGILALSGGDPAGLRSRLAAALERVEAGWAPPLALPDPAELAQPERLVVDFGDRGELLERLRKAHKALESDAPAVWAALQAQGIFRGHGPRPGKLAFLFPGQGSQYLNMGRELRHLSPLVAGVFAEADEVMQPILGRPLSEYIFIDSQGPEQLQKAELQLLQTAITQPAVLTVDMALHRLLEGYGFSPDMVMGHSLGEYAALIAAGIMPFADALEAAAARGREMAAFNEVEDNGWMAAVMAPYETVCQVLESIDGYVVVANINCYSQCVIGGASRAVEQAIGVFQEKGFQARRIPVSHAFHTRIVAPASRPLRQVLDRMRISPPRLPMIANVSGDFYPSEVEAIKDVLEQQVASPVQWIKGLETLYAAGARTFVEVGPKKALKGFVDDVLGRLASPAAPVVSLFTNHPKTGELASFNQALCGLYAAGYGTENPEELSMPPETHATNDNGGGPANAVLQQFAQVLQNIIAGQVPGSEPARVYDRHAPPHGSVVISGTGLGLPGAEKGVMDPDNVQRILRGEQFIDLIPERFRKRILEKNITRVVKSENGNGHFEPIANQDEIIRLAGRAGRFDLVEEYGVPEKLIAALDTTSQLALAAGLEALREAGIPLVQTFRRVSSGKFLPDRWLLPEALRDETGVIFASAFPGGDGFASEMTRYFTWQNRKDQLAWLEGLAQVTSDPASLAEIGRRSAELRDLLAREPYEFDRRFIFRILAMGHSQFAEYIGARGPNTHVNAACASTTQAISLAEDWIRSGRCRRVIVIAADNVTSEHLLEWVGGGMLATGAAATDDSVEEAALPFDRRRHGTLIGMGACALVVESEDALRERGMRGAVELLSSESLNSAYHGTRLDVDHISRVMDNLVTSAERRFGLHRFAMAQQMVFMSHETFTPARGGSASAEVMALRRTFGPAASEIVVANTKGFTGHPMGVGIEDVIAIKILEHGVVPPVPNHKEIDPDLGTLKLSRGGHYPVLFALHLAAGFGSQVAMTLVRRIPGWLDRLENPTRYQRWLDEVSGYDQAELEVVKRVLRIKSQGAPVHSPVGSTWQPGTAPALRAVAPGAGSIPEVHPVPAASRAWPAPAPAVYAPPVATEPQAAPLTQAAGAPPAPVSPPTPAPAPIPLAPTPVRPAVAQPAAQQAVSVRPALDPAPAGVSQDPVVERVLEIVAAKTGYPQDMLELDLDLEADLGIDTVKQAETFLALREAFNIPRRDDLQLRDYPTLARVIDFVRSMLPPEMAAAQPPSAEAQPVEAATPWVEDLSAPDFTPTVSGDPVAERVLEIVAEKTGYPQDMLELDLDLEADLGIDTVKQAETFLALREAFNIPRRDDLQLRDYPTLAHVIGFVRDMTAAVGEPSTPPSLPGPAEATPEPVLPEGLSGQKPRPFPLEAADRFPRRLPQPVLRPALEVCRPTGVELDAGSRVVVAPGETEVGPALAEQLRTLGVEVLLLPPALEAESAAVQLTAQLSEWLAQGPIQGVYWLPGLEPEPDLASLDLPAWRLLARRRVKDLYLTMRTLYTAIQGPGTFLVTATSLGGLHGYGPQPAAGPLGGAVAGFSKAFKREAPQALVKVVDFEPALLNTSPDGVAARLIAETRRDPATVETGYWQGLRYAPVLSEQPVQYGRPLLELGPESVFVVTGASGSITSAILSDLAARGGGAFYLLDLAPLPAEDDPHVALFRTDKEKLKKELIAAGRSGGRRPTPAQIEKQLSALERQEAALRVVQSIRAAGGQAHYRQLDLRDAAAVEAVIAEVRRDRGRIDVLFHAAGVEISRGLPEKDPQQFDLVFDVKADGYFNLLHAAQDLPIAASLAFSSVAGRFGNSGQTDYSAANDLLCKLTSSFRNWRPETRGIVIDWTAWAEIGMASRGSIPKIMAMAGIEMLPPEVGVPTVRRELQYAAAGSEVLVAGSLGLLAQETDPAGGLDPALAAERLAARPAPLVMVGQVKAAGLTEGWQVVTVLDPQVQPFLYDHALGGTPLLPGVMGTEGFAELALAVAGLVAPEGVAPLVLQAVEEVHFHNPFKFYRNEPQTLFLSLNVYPAGSGAWLADAGLKSKREPSAAARKAGMEEVKEKLHFSARLRLGQAAVPPPDLAADLPAAARLPETGWLAVEAEEIYKLYFHGPAYRVLERAQLACETQTGTIALGLLAEALPPDRVPADAAALILPRLVELCFQTVGLWQLKTQGMLALPLAFKGLEVYASPGESGGDTRLYALVQLAGAASQPGETGFDCQVVDCQGRVYLALKDYRTVRFPGS